VVEYLRVFEHVGFFWLAVTRSPRQQGMNPMNKSDFGMAQPGVNPMDKPSSTIAQQIAEAARAFELEATGHPPKSVTVVLSDHTLVITLHGALSPAEQALAATPAGASQVQEFHQKLFANASDSLKQEIKRITGVEVREATAELETSTGMVVKVFTTGTVVHVFLLADKVVAGAWSGNGQSH